MQFDHVAIPSNDIAKSVEWYREKFDTQILYQDSSWAFMLIGQVKVALVSPQQHPPHIAVHITEEQLAAASRDFGIPIDKHRDGTAGIYIHDPFGNAVELICYPPGQTIYGSTREA